MKNRLPQTTDQRLVTEIKSLRQEFNDFKNSLSAFQIFYLGTLDIDIDGGTLDGVTYNAYILNVYIHYEFAKLHTATAIPFYLFWGLTPSYDTGSIFLPNIKKFNEMPILSTSIPATQSYIHSAEYDPEDESEYTKFTWVVSRGSSNVTIPAQNIKLELALLYANKITTLTNESGGGSGGGGILEERIDLYV